jgi:hypothetical protein
MGLAMVLQELYSFLNENNTIHSLLDYAIVYKCENGFYSASQIKKNKNNNKDYV